MAKIVYIPNPIHPENSVELQVEETTVLGAVLLLAQKLPTLEEKQHFLSRRCDVILNGERFEESSLEVLTEVTGDDELIIICNPKGIVAWLVGSIALYLSTVVGLGATAANLVASVIVAAIMIAVSYALNFVSGMLFGADSGGSDNFQGGSPSSESSNTYGWSGPQLNMTPGVMLGIVYGKHRVGGTLLLESVTSDGTSQYRNMLIGVSEGEVESITETEINDQPYDNFSDIILTKRYGINNQTVIPGLEKTRVYYAVTPSREVIYGSSIIHTMQDQGDAVDIKLSFSAGLYAVSRTTGNVVSNSCTFKIYYREYGDSIWILYNTYTETNSIKSAVPCFKQVSFPARGKYELKIEKTSPAADSSSSSSGLYLTAVEEIENQEHVYPNTALLYVEALASEQLSGSQPNITSLVHGIRCYVPELKIGGVTQDFYACYYDNDAGEYKRISDDVSCVFANTYVRQWTDNPLWCIYDLCTSERYGGGTYINPSNLDATHYFAQGSYCDEFISDLRESTVIAVTATDLEVATSIFVDADVGRHVLVTLAAGGTTKGIITTVVDASNIECAAGWSNGTPSAADEVVILQKRFTVNYVIDSQMDFWDAISTIALACHGVPAWLNGEIRVIIDKPQDPVQKFTMGTIVPDTFNIRYLPSSEKFNGFIGAFYDEDRHYSRNPLFCADSRREEGEPDRFKQLTVYGITEAWRCWRHLMHYLLGAKYRRKAVSFATSLYGMFCQIGDVITVAHDVPEWGQSSHIVFVNEATKTITIGKEITFESGSYTVRVQVPDGTGGWELVTKNVTNSPGTTRLITYDTAFSTRPYSSMQDEKVSPVAILKTTTVESEYRIIDLTAEIEKGLVTLSCLEHRDDLFDYTGFELPTFIYSEGRNPLAVNQVTALSVTEAGTLLGDGTFVPELSVSWDWPQLSTLQISTVKGANIYIRTDPDAPWKLYQMVSRSNSGILIQDVVVGLTYYVKVQAVSNYMVFADFETAPTDFEIISGKTSAPSGSGAFSVNQLDKVIRFQWTPITDLDVFAYEIRRGVTWDTGEIVADKILSNFFETVDFIPGEFNYILRARDNSGNLSETEREVEITLTSPSDRIPIAIEELLICAWKRNLAPNMFLSEVTGGNFDDYTSGTENTATVTAVSDPKKIAHGDYACEVACNDDAGGASEGFIVTTDYSIVDSTRAYEFSAYFKAVEGDPVGYIEVECFDSGSSSLGTVIFEDASLKSTRFGTLQGIVYEEGSSESDYFPVGTTKIKVKFGVKQSGTQVGDCTGVIDFLQIRKLYHNGYLMWFVNPEVGRRCLRPKTQKSWGDGTDWDDGETWDYPVVEESGVYTTETIDIGSIQTYLLSIYKTMEFHYVGTEDTYMQIEINSSDDNSTWNGWENFATSKYSGRYFKFRFTFQTQDISYRDYLVIQSLELYVYKFIDSTTITDFTIAAGGTAITFADYNLSFYTAPAVIVSLQDGSGGLTVEVASKTTSGCTIHVYDAVPASVGGTVDIYIVGA